MCDTEKGEQDIRSFGGGPGGKVDGKDPRVMSWRIQRVQKGACPLSAVVAFGVREHDVIEKVSSRSINPGFGNEAT